MNLSRFVTEQDELVLLSEGDDDTEVDDDQVL